HLLVLPLVEARNLKEPSIALIENRREDAWRVEVRKATPVDRTVHAHERHRMQVADNAVGLDRLIGHFGTRFSKRPIGGQGIILDIETENLNSERSRRRSSVAAEELKGQKLRACRRRQKHTPCRGKTRCLLSEHSGASGVR